MPTRQYSLIASLLCRQVAQVVSGQDRYPTVTVCPGSACPLQQASLTPATVVFQSQEFLDCLLALITAPQDQDTSS